MLVEAGCVHGSQILTREQDVCLCSVVFQACGTEYCILSWIIDAFVTWALKGPGRLLFSCARNSALLLHLAWIFVYSYNRAGGRSATLDKIMQINVCICVSSG